MPERTGVYPEVRGDVAAARELYAQALAAYKALGNEAGTASVLGNLAELEFGDGQVEQALRLAGEALEIESRGKNATNLAIGHRQHRCLSHCAGRHGWSA